MRVAILGVLVLLCPTGAALAGPREDAMAVLERWVRAFEASDVDTITGLYAPDALFMGTGSRTVVVVNGLDATYATRDGTTIENPGRFTAVVGKRGADWRIVHFHRSGMPGGGRR